MARRASPKDESLPGGETPGWSDRGPFAPFDSAMRFPVVQSPIAPPEEPESRVLDLESEQPSPFLRAQKRIPVRRGALPKKTVSKLKYALAGLAVAASIAGLAGSAYAYSRRSWRFRLESSDQIQLSGNDRVGRRQILEVFGPDISRNVFSIPLGERQAQLQRIPWVESATVMRLLPNRLSIHVGERIPVAFAQLGMRVALVDHEGVILDLPAKTRQKFSFPVILGLKDADPLSQRAATIRLYQKLLHDLDAGGANYSRDLSEVNLSDPEDVRVLVADPQGEVLIHLGSSSFLERYQLFVAHAQEWRRHFLKLESVDLRYDRQVIVNPEAPRLPAAADESPAPAAAKAAEAKKQDAKMAAHRPGRLAPKPGTVMAKSPKWKHAQAGAAGSARGAPKKATVSDEDE